jgi:hypothetical protein
MQNLDEETAWKIKRWRNNIKLHLREIGCEAGR